MKVSIILPTFDERKNLGILIKKIFTIIIPTYNRKVLLSRCLESLLSQGYPKKDYEIIVVDDGSTDGTELLVKSIREKHTNLRYFKIDHLGQGAARNIGLKKAKGKFIAFTDDDCVVEKNWLKKIESAFAQNITDVVGGSIVNPTNRYIAWAQYILNFSSWFPKGVDRYVRDIPTANIIYRRLAINNHFFPEYLSSWVYEDSLYNFHLYKNKKRILFCPKIKIKHFTWDENYGLKKFFKIQKKAAVGFALGGYKTNGKIGEILVSFRVLNLFCPRLVMVFLRCVRYGYFTKFIFCFPLISLGEFYRGVVICSTNKRKLFV